MKFETAKNLAESVQFVKFKYANYKEDPRPRVKALDFEYPGQKGQKTYGQRKDILGFNINYFKNKKYAKKAIDEIDSFARLLDADKKEKWKRLSFFYPEATKFLRRYNKEHVDGLKQKKGIYWKSATFQELVNKDKEAF